MSICISTHIHYAETCSWRYLDPWAVLQFCNVWFRAAGVEFGDVGFTSGSRDWGGVPMVKTLTQN